MDIDGLAPVAFDIVLWHHRPTVEAISDGLTSYFQEPIKLNYGA
jgi:hypothetical protein